MVVVVEVVEVVVVAASAAGTGRDETSEASKRKARFHPSTPVDYQGRGRRVAAVGRRSSPSVALPWSPRVTSDQ